MQYLISRAPCVNAIVVSPLPFSCFASAVPFSFSSSFGFALSFSTSFSFLFSFLSRSKDLGLVRTLELLCLWNQDHPAFSFCSSNSVASCLRTLNCGCMTSYPELQPISFLAAAIIKRRSWGLDRSELLLRQTISTSRRRLQ